MYNLTHMAKPVLTPADINLLKKVFATKKDLQNFTTKNDLIQLEKRLGNRFATKKDLRALAEELKNFTKEQLEEFSIFLKEYFEEIKLEGTLHDHERRIKQIEDITPGLPS